MEEEFELKNLIGSEILLPFKESEYDSKKKFFLFDTQKNEIVKDNKLQEFNTYYKLRLNFFDREELAWFTITNVLIYYIKE